MKTLSEIDQEEAARREAADQYERVVNRVDNFTRAIARLEPQVPKYQEQVDLAAKMEALAAEIDSTIQGKGGYLARGLILSHLSAVGEDQRRRLDEVTATLRQAREELAKAQVALKAFEENSI